MLEEPSFETIFIPQNFHHCVWPFFASGAARGKNFFIFSLDDSLSIVGICQACDSLALSLYQHKSALSLSQNFLKKDPQSFWELKSDVTESVAKGDGAKSDSGDKG